MRFWIRVVTATGFMVVGLQLLFGLGWLPVATFAESNLTNNEVRLQKLFRNRDAGLVVLGSSLAGRLPEAAFPAEWKAVNLGLDGGNSAFGAGLLLKWNVEPGMVVVEGNSIAKERSGNDPILEERIRSLTFHWSTWMAPWRAERRPFSAFYSWLKTRKDEATAGSGGTNAEAGLSAAVMKTQPGDQELLNGRILPERLQALRDQGAEVLIVMAPDGGADRSEEYRVASAVSARTGIPVLDVKGEFDETIFRYTDGLHLSPPSARRVVQLIEEALNASQEQTEVKSTKP